MTKLRRFTAKVGGISVDVVFRSRRRFVLRPRPDGTVELSAPRSFSKRAVEQWLAVEGAPALASVARRLPNEEELGRRRAWSCLADGDEVAIWGRPVRVRLARSPGRPAARVDGGTLELLVCDPLDDSEAARHERRRLFEGLLRRELSSALPEVKERAEKACGTRTGRWTVRRMRSRWGSCRPDTGAVSISLDLACHDPAFLELVATHEAAHVAAPNHGASFQALMDRALPAWRELQTALDSEGMRLPREAPRPAASFGRAP
ncbi:YgjP-like metallopeptidase domain-containing protein [Atopobiaceae bacterium 24-176]